MNEIVRFLLGLLRRPLGAQVSSSVHSNRTFCFAAESIAILYLTTVLLRTRLSLFPKQNKRESTACGTVERVTIVCDKFTGKPKGAVK